MFSWDVRSLKWLIKLYKIGFEAQKNDSQRCMPDPVLTSYNYFTLGPTELIISFIDSTISLIL